MAIIDYKGGIYRDINVFPPNVYTKNGQGCGTVWYESVQQARKIIERLGYIPEGKDAGLCEKCSCHYPFGSKEYNEFPKFACKEWKLNIAKGYK